MNIQIASFDFTDVDLTPPTRDPYNAEYWLCGTNIEVPITVKDSDIVIEVSTTDHGKYQTTQILPTGSIPDRW